jgi:hypothetical protein
VGWAQGQAPRPGTKTPKNAKNPQLWKAGPKNNRRPKRVLRNKKENIYLGTWNVLTMLQPGKMQKIAEQIMGGQREERSRKDGNEKLEI